MANPPITGSLVSALSQPVEATLSTILAEFDWSDRELLTAISDVADRLDAWGIECTPPLGSGDLGTVRILRVPGNNPAALADDEIAAGEGPLIEFKETLLLDTKKNVLGGVPLEKCASTTVLISSLKTVAGFLNSSGGTLLIGVTDTGEKTCLSREYLLTCPKGIHNFDQWELYFRSMIERYFVNGRSVSASVLVQRIRHEDDDFARVTVGARKAITFLKVEGKEELYVRSGNRTLSVQYSDIEQFFECSKLYL